MKSSGKEEKWSPIDCGQNLPAVLNDPKKGKQKDFFTRSWGDSFVDNLPIGSSPYLYQLSEHAFDRYIRRIRKHFRPNGSIKPLSLVNGPSRSTNKKTIPPISGVPKFFLDSDFDLMRPEIFSYIFPFLLGNETSSGSAGELLNYRSQSKEVQESISHHLDIVEINLGHHLAQKYHHFFQVMAYQDALMSQLKALIKVVRELRGDLRDLYEPMNQSLKISQLLRRKSNLQRVKARLNSMTFLHQTQPTIQLLLTGSEFSGALDLIKTSKDILRVELKGVLSFRHLFSQMDEMQSIISKILVSDFRKIIVEEVEKHTFLKRATVLDDSSTCNEDFNEGKLYSVIHGLITLNSFTFLEELEESCANAVKNIIEKCVSVLPHSKDEMSTTSFKVGEFAKIATPEGWTDLFDMLLGSLIVLLRRVKLVQGLILNVIQKVYGLQQDSSNSRHSLEDSSYKVLLNVCDLINERCSMLLGLRFKSEAVSLMTLPELKSIEKLIFILDNEIKALSFGSQGNYLVPTLQTLFLQFLECFDERVHSRVNENMEVEKWVKIDVDMNELMEKCSRFPTLTHHFSKERASSGPCISYTDEGPSYDILKCALEFLYIIVEYLHLSIELPAIKTQLGLKLALIFGFYNSRVCQFILGLAALKFQALERVAINHLILTHNSIDFISRFIPKVASEFLETSNDQKKIPDGLQRQFEIASSRYSDHKQEIIDKMIVTLVNLMEKEFLACSWESKKSVPSQNFKNICRFVSVFHQKANPTLPPEAMNHIMTQVHLSFIEIVKQYIKMKQRKPPKFDRVSRDLLSEMVYYGQSLLRITDVIPPENANNEFFERELWK